jgi:hypothetical protein
VRVCVCVVVCVLCVCVYATDVGQREAYPVRTLTPYSLALACLAWLALLTLAFALLTFATLPGHCAALLTCPAPDERLEVLRLVMESYAAHPDPLPGASRPPDGELPIDHTVDRDCRFRCIVTVDASTLLASPWTAFPGASLGI